MKDAFSIDPPQLDPSICASTGARGKRPVPEDERLPVAAIHQRVGTVLRLDAQDRTFRQPIAEDAAFHAAGLQ